MIQGAEVIVIGGGPAGLAAAIAARQKGFSAIVIDGTAPPIDKACGEGLLPETQAALKELGVQIAAEAGHRFRGVRFVDGSVQLQADFPAGQGIGIRRTVLHELLATHAKHCGVELLWRAPVTGISPEGVQLPGLTLKARWIVGADGIGSRARRWARLEAARQRKLRSAVRRHYRVKPWADHAEVHWGAKTQAYVTPVSPEEVCVVMIADKPEEAAFERVLNVLPELRERLADGELHSRERGAVAAMHSLKQVTRGNVALVGDASGGVDAITGEGLRLAFRQALA